MKSFNMLDELRAKLQEAVDELEEQMLTKLEKQQYDNMVVNAIFAKALKDHKDEL